MKIVLYSILAFLCPVCISFAQSPPANIRPLTIGDTLPRGIVLKNVLNHPVSKIQLDDYRGKAVILDFWATYCGTCVASFPVLQKLQDEFEKELLVLPVTNQNKAIVQPFIASNRHAKNTRLPFVYSDTLLKAYFPYYSLPHQVWINKSGVVKAISYADGFTRTNILKLIQNAELNMAYKNDQLVFDRHARLKDNMNAKEALFVYETLFTHYLPGAPSSMSLIRDSINRKVRLQFYNLPLHQLYARSYKEIEFNRIILEGVDRSLFEKGTNVSDWRERLLYCAEISYADSIPIARARMQLKYTVDAFLHARSYFEMRKVNVFSMTIADKSKIPISKAGNTFNSLLDKGPETKRLQHYPLSTLVSAMNKLASANGSKVIVLDETNLDELIDLQLSVDSIDQIPEMKAALSKYGIDITEVEREINMFIIEKLDD